MVPQLRRRAAQQGLAADNRQLDVPEFCSILASGPLWRRVDGQRCLLQLKPDPLDGEPKATLEVEHFSQIESEFTNRVRSMVLCNAATIDRQQRPYSRILHPLWEGSTGWVLTHRDSHKAKHLERNPFMSLSYIRGDVQKPLYVDCKATWIEADQERERIWNLAASEPPPLGFDPAPDFESPRNPNFGVLRLSPWRIVLVTFPAESYDAGHLVWRDKTVR